MKLEGDWQREAIAAHARGDWVAERRALDALALHERGLANLVDKLAAIDDYEQDGATARGVITGPTPNQMTRDLLHEE